MTRATNQKNSNSILGGAGVCSHLNGSGQSCSSEDYLFMLALEDKYTAAPSAWLLAQAFKENKDAAIQVRDQLVKELEAYKPWIRKHPFNINFMKIDPRTKRVNEIDKFLSFARVVDKPEQDGRTTEFDIQKAKMVPIESLYSFKGKHKNMICPFHDEKNPSFHIYKDSNRYKCFSCGVSGDSIDFLMRLEGISFVTAVERFKNGN